MPNRITKLASAILFSFLAGIRQTPIACLGVDDFGQSGDVPDLYRAFGIDTDTIVGAASDLIE